MFGVVARVLMVAAHLRILPWPGLHRATNAALTLFAKSRRRVYIHAGKVQNFERKHIPRIASCRQDA